MNQKPQTGLFNDYLVKNYYFTRLASLIQCISNFFVVIFYNLFFEVEVEYIGKRPDPMENLIYCSNHVSLNDPPILSYALGTPIAYIAKQELFDNPIVNFVIRFMSAIPVNREATGSSTIKLARKALKTSNWKVAIFIEGTRSTDDELGEAQAGAMFLAKITKVRVLPVRIKYFSKTKLKVVVGEAYQPDFKTNGIEGETEICFNKIAELI
jgi:1-acyl-sn-glycerol-3-phosphate acyltransferase